MANSGNHYKFSLYNKFNSDLVTPELDKFSYLFVRLHLSSQFDAN